MKKITKILGILLILGLIFAGFAGAASATDYNITSLTVNGINVAIGEQSPTETTGITVTDVSVPSGGTAPNIVVNTISWSGDCDNGKFKEGVEYTATLGVTITNASSDTGNNYKFGTGTTVNASGSKSASASTTEDTSTIKIKYKTPYSVDNVSVTIPEPKTGEVPATIDKITVNGNATVTSIAWSPSCTSFAYDTQYTATIELVPKSDYVFDSTVTVNINGSSKTATPSNSKISVTSDTFTKTTTGTISSIQISDITAPATGNTPDTSATVTMKTSGNVSLTPTTTTISWSPTATTFSANTAYTMSLSLTPPTGYAFASNISNSDVTIMIGNSSSGTSAKTATISDGKLNVTYTFPETTKTIDTIDITVTAPSTGATPSASATVKGNTSLPISTDATAKWYKVTNGTASNTETTSAFEAKSTYKVTVTIPKLSGTYKDYSYSNNPAITINGTAITSSNYSITNGIVTASYTFSETGKTKIATINVANLDSPVVGNTPDTSATATGYASGSTTSITLPTPTVAWYQGSTTQTSAFQPDTAYTVKITLTPATNTEFTTSPTVKIGDTTISSSEITATADSVTINHTYAKTVGTISAVSLTSTTPELDKMMSTSVSISSVTPSNSINTPTLTWNPSGTKFEGGQTYTATITVTTKTGYTFSSYPTVNLNGSSISSSDITISSDKKTMTIKHTYSKLATPITSVAINMDEPIAGKKAKTTTTSITSSPSSNLQATISWSPSIPESGEFDEETEYKATITVTNTNSDYAFTSGTTATINGELATISSQKATTMTVTYTFDKTNKKGILSLPIGDEVATIPYPKDFFSELVALFQAIFNFDNWKLFG